MKLINLNKKADSKDGKFLIPIEKSIKKACEDTENPTE